MPETVNDTWLTEHGADHVELRGAGTDIAPARFDRDAFIGVLLALRGGIFSRVITARPVDAGVAYGGTDRHHLTK